MATVFTFSDYKQLLSHWIESGPSGGHGLRKKLAESAGCKTAYISQVLGGKAHFSLEQAERVSGLLGLGADEKRFFLLMVQRNRAGTAALESHFAEEMSRLLAARARLKNRLRATKELSTDDHALYFDTWAVAAVHAATTIPECRTRQEIAKAAGISVGRAARILEFLVSRGLLAETPAGYRTGPMHIHLPEGSPFLARHHLSWRNRTIQQIEERNVGGLHYSAVLAFASKDAPKVKSILADALAAVRALIEPSPEEELFAIGTDFFALGRSARQSGEDRSG